MKKLNLTYLQPQQARGFRYIQVPWELLDNPDYEPLDYGAVMLYSLMLNRAGWSAIRRRKQEHWDRQPPLNRV